MQFILLSKIAGRRMHRHCLEMPLRGGQPPILVVAVPMDIVRDSAEDGESAKPR
jgi:hypothetical protein